MENKTKKITKTAFLLIIVTMFAKVFGFLREVVLGSFFGTSYKKDALLASQLVPGVLFASIMASFSTTFIPLYNEISVREGKERSKKFVNNSISLIFFVASIISIFGIIFSNQIVNITVAGFDLEKKVLTANLLKITFVYIIFLGINYIFQGYLQSNEKFIIPALTSLPFNAIIISSTFLANKYDIYGVAVGYVLGYLSMVIFQLIFILKNGYKPKIKIDFLNDQYIKKMFKLIVPVFIGSSVMSLNSFVDKYLASHLQEGSISALDYADRLNGLVYGIFSSSIVTIMYPYLSRFFAGKQHDQFRKYLTMSINILIILMIPISFGMFLLNKEIVEVVYQRGAFNQKSTILTAGALTFFSIGYLGYSIRDILSRTFYSIQDTLTPMKNGIFAVFINIFLNIILVRFLQHKGLALGTSIVSYISVFLLLRSLRKKIGNLNIKNNIIVLLKSIFSASIMCIVIYLIKEYLPINSNYNFIIKSLLLGLYIIISFLIYSFTIYILNITEVKWLVTNVKIKVKTLIYKS
ncbi:murein biosynthesis integral membrane protein MurJ [Caldicellulosiruptoraceae bacterium PP1]